MKMLVEFDVDADIIDVPQYVIDHRQHYRNQFLEWLYDPSVKHKYRRTWKCADGSKFVGMSYRSDAFVEWLNRKLRKAGDCATVLEQNVSIAENHGIFPSVFF